MKRVLRRWSELARTSRAMKGFTLVEVMVAVSIFTVIMVLGVSALLSTTAASSQARADRRATDTLSVFFEQFTRTARTGRDFVSTADDRIEFIDQDGYLNRYTYQSADGSILYEQMDQSGTVDKTVTVAGSSNSTQLASVQFLLEGNDATDTYQPIVRVIVSGTSTDRRKTSTFAIQTAVSPRVLQAGNQIQTP